MIDTLMYVKKLEASGVSREQAELQVQMMTEIVDTNYATKQDMKDVRLEIKDVRRDINDLRSEFKHDMIQLRTELKSDAAQLRTEFKHDMARLEDRLTIKLGSLMIVGISALATILKFF